MCPINESNLIQKNYEPKIRNKSDAIRKPRLQNNHFSIFPSSFIVTIMQFCF